MSIVIYPLVGALISILVNYLADVLPYTRRFSTPVCHNCSQAFKLRNYLFSFRCPNCGNKTPFRVIAVGIFSILLSTLVYLFPLGGLSFWATVPIMLFLGVVLIIDIEHRAVLIETSILGILLFLVYGVIMHGWVQTLLGGVSGFLIMYLIYLFGKLFTKVLGKIRHQEITEIALGFGDVYVCTFMGLFTGWPGTVGIVLLAILASGAFSLIYMIITVLLKKYQSLTAFPYAPFLIIAGIALFYLV